MKAGIKIVALLLMMLYSGIAYTQTKWVDSLKNVVAMRQQADTSKVNILNSIGDFYSFREPDSAFVYAQQALALAEQLNYTKGKFWAIVYTNKALYALGNYALELSFAFSAIPLAQELGDPNALGWSLGILGDCYFNLGQYDTALSYYRKIKSSAERDSITDLFSIYSGLVPVFVHLHQEDSALFYAKKGLTSQAQNPLLNGSDDRSSDAKSIVYRFMGEAFAATVNSDSALYYYKRSLPYAEKNGMDINTIDVYNGIAAVYQKMQLPATAIGYARKQMTENVLHKYPVGYLKAANIMTAAYELLNLPDSTLKYLRIAYSVNEGLFNREKTIAVQNVFFNQKQQQKEIAAATSKLHYRYTLYFTLAFMAVVLVITSFVLRNKRLRELQVVRNNIADDLHDDIGSALSSIGIMSELAKQKSPQALPLLASIEENTWAIQDNMSDIVWAIKSENDRFQNVLQRMQVFATEMLDAKNIQIDFRVEPAVTDLQLSMKQRKNFYLFFKEVINNAAKYSGANKVMIALSKINQHVKMIVTDDGKGFDTSKVFAGNGMGSLKKRATELNGDCSIGSFTGGGTVVTLRFKIT